MFVEFSHIHVVYLTLFECIKWGFGQKNFKLGVLVRAKALPATTRSLVIALINEGLSQRKATDRLNLSTGVMEKSLKSTRIAII